MKLLIHISFMVHCSKLVVVRVLWMDVTSSVLWSRFTFLYCLVQFCIALLQNFVASFGIMKNKVYFICKSALLGFALL